ncbi:hypothetical protein WJX79_002039 [Trebouxia sp. C0005]
MSDQVDADIPLPNEPDDRDYYSDDSRNIRDAGSDDEGEDLQEDAERDYRPNEVLDAYEEEGIDEAPEAEDVTLEEQLAARARAERELNKRDRRENRRGLPGALEESDSDESDRRPARRRRVEAAQADDMDDDEVLGDLDMPFEDIKGPLSNWVKTESIQRQIQLRFRAFLDQYRDENNSLVYKPRIRDMCIDGQQSLLVDLDQLALVQTDITIWLQCQPKIVMELLHQVAKEVVLLEYPEYENIHKDIFVRVEATIEENIRDLRQHHLNSLIRCSFVVGPFFQNTENEIKVGACPSCQSQGPFELNVAETVYRNYQKITVQESPGTVPAGRLPRHKEVVLLHDLINRARPGEEVMVTGVYVNTYDATLNARNGFPVFSTQVEANWLSKSEDKYASFRLTDEDKDEINRLSKDPNIAQKICKSIAPSIYGHDNIKKGVAMALFGGQEKHPGGKHRLRGDINLLLLGDPGTAKSQFLKYVEKVAQRAVYTTGKGASAVGLTASVQKDPITREWTLEGGALVLADKGVCLIDEFDKMNDQDRVSIHEAMEQQSISISKAGIVTSLQARCSVIAAANPIGGRYDSSRTFAENVELTDPILSRFDILCVVKDKVDPVADEMLANFVIDSHMRSHPDKKAEEAAAQEETAPDPSMLSQEMLRKYITFAKQNCHPKLANADYEKISQVYAELRRESAISHGMPIAVRHLESIIRMSEASAMMHLREYVNEEDVNVAISVMIESFISTQKTSVQKLMSRKFRHFLTHKQDLNDLIMHALQALVRDQLRYEQAMGEDVADDNVINISCRSLEDKVREYEIFDLRDFYMSTHFSKAEFQLDPGAGLITRHRSR